MKTFLHSRNFFWNFSYAKLNLNFYCVTKSSYFFFEQMRERKLIKYTQLREKFKTRLALFRCGVCAYIKNRKLIKFFLNEFGAFFPR